ncbi:TPA: FolB domain-containing protein [Pseudomonas aeruginosa]|uniref:FolB domain-containing protein n=1 Tax=Pseudomonas TaxID=286 RepID=UPI000D21269F|nr:MULTISPECIES: FolB domain-containing protein [Pseudomonas]AVZ17525.1 FolB domain-containing protein [Pseudomonas aeruginosa]
MARIRIKDLHLRTYIGTKEEEIRNKQNILINLSILYRATDAARDNNINYALNYRTISKAVIQFVENNRFTLLERLIQEILDLVMEYIPVCFAKIEVDKPHPTAPTTHWPLPLTS